MDSGGAHNAILVLVAHPDDETIFMGGLIQRLIAAGHPVDIACATGCFGSPALTRTRIGEFSAAGLAMGASTLVLDLADAPGPLPLRALERHLQALNASVYRRVYTHGVFGEYGHRHHRDVCLAAHRVFGTLTYCLAGPLEADLQCVLTPDELGFKRSIAQSCYRSVAGIAGSCSSLEQYTHLAPALAEGLIGLANGELDRRIAASGEDARLRALVARCHRAFTGDGTPYPELAGLPHALWRPNQRRFAALFRAVLRLWDTTRH